MKFLLRSLTKTLLIFMVLLLCLSGCQEFFSPPNPIKSHSFESSDSPGTRQPLPTEPISTQPTITTTAEPTTAEPTTASSMTEGMTTAPTTASPSPSMPPISGSPGVSNSSKSWYFIRPDQLNNDEPNIIPNAIAKMIAPYHVVWQRPIEGRKIVYLTMDQGYEYENNTTQILDTAKLKGVPITFFLTGAYIKREPDLVIRMLEEGHLLGNHTYDHPNLSKLAAQGGGQAVLHEIRRLEDAYRDLTGQELSRFCRPPMGIYSEFVLDALTREGYTAVFWSFAYRDWLTDDQPDPAEAKSWILSQLHNGSVILLHSVSKTNTAILGELIDEIRARGYEFARLDDEP